MKLAVTLSQESAEADALYQKFCTNSADFSHKKKTSLSPQYNQLRGLHFKTILAL